MPDLTCPTCQKVLVVDPTGEKPRTWCPVCQNSLPALQSPVEMGEIREENFAFGDASEQEIAIRNDSIKSLNRRAKRFIVGGLIFVLVSLAIGAIVAVVVIKIPDHKAVTITDADLLKIEGPKGSEEDFVTYFVTDMVETGLVIEYHRQLREKWLGPKFVLIPVQDRWLLATVDSDFAGGPVTGLIVSNTYSAVGEKAFQKLCERRPEFRENHLPFMLLEGGTPTNKLEAVLTLFAAPLAVLLLAIGGLSCLYGWKVRGDARWLRTH